MRNYSYKVYPKMEEYCSTSTETGVRPHLYVDHLMKKQSMYQSIFKDEFNGVYCHSLETKCFLTHENYTTELSKLYEQGLLTSKGYVSTWNKPIQYFEPLPFEGGRIEKIPSDKMKRVRNSLSNHSQEKKKNFSGEEKIQHSNLTDKRFTIDCSIEDINFYADNH